MARRGRRRKFKLKINIRPDTVRSVLALFLILLAILSLMSFFVSSDYAISARIQRALRGALGWASILVPPLLAAGGFLFIHGIKLKIKEPRVVIGLFTLTTSLSGLLHIFVSSDEAGEVASRGGGGGFVGYKIAGILSDTISVSGGFVFLLITFTIALLVTFDVSLERLLEFASKYISSEKLKGLLSKVKKEGEEEDEIEISSGLEISAEDSTKTSAKTTEESGDLGEPSFEIIPSMSEPQSPKSLEGLDLVGRSGISPSLPYVDRVWKHPPLSLLATPNGGTADTGDIEARAKIICDTLKSFGIGVSVVDIKAGPSVTQYALKAKSGTKVSKIANLHNDLAMALASPTGTVRIEAPIPGKSLIGIEVPNNTRELLYFRSLIASDAMKALKSKIGTVLGSDVAGRIHVYDISKMPHILIAGATGSGKSVFIHNVIFSILFRASPQEVKFIIVDPKRVEMTHYQGIPHLLTPIVTDMDKAPSVFKWAVAEMERRYVLFEQAKTRNIEAYNEKSGFQAMPHIIIVVDELGEIMARDPAGVERSIIRIAQLARATGIHLILAVQRPSTNIITGLIKANIPARVAFNVASQVDSRVIIDQPGAEKLLGKGDMLFIPPEAPKPVRLQGAFISDKEINALVDYLKGQGIEADYKEEVLSMDTSPSGGGSSDWGDDVDSLFDKAVSLIVSAGKASASMLQRKLSIGYARAARIIDEMEEKGIVGPSPGGSRPRDVLLKGMPSGPGGVVGTPNLSNLPKDPSESVESIQST